MLVIGGGLGDFWDRAIRFQAERDSPFSVWGLYDLAALQLVAQVAVASLGRSPAARVRRADRYALAAALLVAVQLDRRHWFYLYLVWFLPVALVALLRPTMRGRSTGSIDSARPASDAAHETALSHGSSVAVP